MKKAKEIIVVIAIMISGFILGACANTTMAEQIHPLKIWHENRNEQMETWKVIDEDTGVNYIVVAPRWCEKGYSYDGVCITPRLKDDGSLYISK